MNNVVKLTTAAIVLAIGMILSSVVLSKFLVRIKHEKFITVKGYAESDVKADIGKFSCYVRVKGTDLKDAYSKLEESRKAVLGYLAGRGFSESEIRKETIITARINKRDEKGNERNETEGYDASQTVSVTSSNVAMIMDVASSITDLIKEGIEIGVVPPEFLVSDLKDAKVKLLANATDDGYRRALALAENSRARVGSLVSAEQGVLQITKRNSTDTSGYGMYDTSTIEKTVKAIVTLEYTIEPKN